MQLLTKVIIMTQYSFDSGQLVAENPFLISKGSVNIYIYNGIIFISSTPSISPDSDV